MHAPYTNFVPSPKPVVHLRDTFGRIADDLRISVTDRCNFRCVYCMPAAGLPWLAREEVLTFEEIVRLTRILVEQSGGRTIRLRNVHIGMIPQQVPDRIAVPLAHGIEQLRICPGKEKRQKERYR